jgi:hypothetical protein
MRNVVNAKHLSSQKISDVQLHAANKLSFRSFKQPTCKASFKDQDGMKHKVACIFDGMSHLQESHSSMHSRLHKTCIFVLLNKTPENPNNVTYSGWYVIPDQAGALSETSIV